LAEGDFPLFTYLPLLKVANISSQKPTQNFAPFFFVLKLFAIRLTKRLSGFALRVLI
jgi:hypothetical protein